MAGAFKIPYDPETFMNQRIQNQKQEPKLSFFEYVRSILGILIFFLVFLIATPIIIILLILSFGKLTNFIVEKIAPLMMKPVFAVSGIDFKIKVYGNGIEYPAVFLVNHSSTVDLLTILALGLPRVRFVAKWELQYNPLFFILGRLTGQVFIKRQDTEKAIAAMQKAYNRVRRNKLSVLMAPEGSRKHPGVIGPFKKGPFHLAIDLGYPVVPIYFEGNRALSVGGSLLAKSGKAVAHIHEPIDTGNWSKETLEQHLVDVRRRYLNWAGLDPSQDEVDSIA